MPDPTAVPSEGRALAEAERYLRDRIEEMAWHDDATNAAIAVLLAEYAELQLRDRMHRRQVASAAGEMARVRSDRERLYAELSRCRKVVQASTALVKHLQAPFTYSTGAQPGPATARLLDALAAEVATLSDTEGSGT